MSQLISYYLFSGESLLEPLFRSASLRFLSGWNVEAQPTFRPARWRSSAPWPSSRSPRPSRCRSWCSTPGGGTGSHVARDPRRDGALGRNHSARRGCSASSWSASPWQWPCWWTPGGTAPHPPMYAGGYLGLLTLGTPAYWLADFRGRHGPGRHVRHRTRRGPPPVVARRVGQGHTCPQLASQPTGVASVKEAQVAAGVHQRVGLSRGRPPSMALLPGAAAGREGAEHPRRCRRWSQRAVLGVDLGGASTRVEHGCGAFCCFSLKVPTITVRL